MTRAQIADPDLVAKLRAGDARADPPVHPLQPDVPGARRPQPDRDVHRRADGGPRDRGPRLVRAGARRRATSPSSAAGRPGWRRPASPRAAGHRRARSSSATTTLGGLAAVAGPNGAARRLAGRRGRPARRRRPHSAPTDVARRRRRVVQCTGGRAGAPRVRGRRRRRRRSTSPTSAAGTVALPDRRRRRRCSTRSAARSRVALAEELGERAVLVTQDHIAGNELSRTGDLAPANVRLAQRGVRIERRSAAARASRAGEVELEDRFTGVERDDPVRRRSSTAASASPPTRSPAQSAQAGDCVAPRTVHEAILEARRRRAWPSDASRRRTGLVPSGAMGHRRRLGLAVLASVALATACNDTDTTAPTATGTVPPRSTSARPGAIATPDTVVTAAEPRPRRSDDLRRDHRPRRRAPVDGDAHDAGPATADDVPGRSQRRPGRRGRRLRRVRRAHGHDARLQPGRRAPAGGQPDEAAGRPDRLRRRRTDEGRHRPGRAC